MGTDNMELGNGSFVGEGEKLEERAVGQNCDELCGEAVVQNCDELCGEAVCGSINDTVAQVLRLHRESEHPSIQGLIGGASEVIERCETEDEIYKGKRVFLEIEKELLGFVYTIDEIKKILRNICLRFDLDFEEKIGDFFVMPDGFVLNIPVFKNYIEENRRFGIKVDESLGKLVLFELA